MHKLFVAGWLGLALGLSASITLAECVAEPDDYRMSAFRAPVPCTLEGGSVVAVDEVREMAGDAAILIDVLPAPRLPSNLPQGTVWQPMQRQNIPGSVWLPNTGFGELPVEEEQYFRANLERLTGGDRSRKLVFYCLADCWMSWNAARRALAWGYTDVAWFPEGIDAWRRAGLSLEESLPVPLSVE